MYTPRQFCPDLVQNCDWKRRNWFGFIPSEVHLADQGITLEGERAEIEWILAELHDLTADNGRTPWENAAAALELGIKQMRSGETMTTLPSNPVKTVSNKQREKNKPARICAVCGAIPEPDAPIWWTVRGNGLCRPCAVADGRWTPGAPVIPFADVPF